VCRLGSCCQSWELRHQVVTEAVNVTVRLSQFGHGIPESGGLSAFDISSKRDSLLFT
jgi:hypothetical protein